MEIGSRHASNDGLSPHDEQAFGLRPRKVRARQGVSQDMLARAPDVHPTSIGQLERGGREPRLTTILRLAHGLGVEPGELVNGLD